MAFLPVPATINLEAFESCLSSVKYFALFTNGLAQTKIRGRQDVPGNLKPFNDYATELCVLLGCEVGIRSLSHDEAYV